MSFLDSLITRANDGDFVFLAKSAATVVSGCALSAAVYRLWLHPLAKIPGPKYMALSDIPGQWHALVSFDSSPRAIKLHRKYGPIVRIGPNRVIVACDIAWPQVHGVRGSGGGGAGEFGKVAGFLTPTDHLSLLGASYDNHRRQRRQLNHAFSVSALHEQEGIITQYVDRLMAEISARAEQGESINIVDWLNLYTFDVIGDLCFGESFNGLEGNTTFVDNTFRSIEVDSAVEAGKAIRDVGKLKARTRMAQGEREDGRRDFATYMLRKDKDGQRTLSDAEVEALSSILVVAGSETTATALSGFVFFLCQSENAGKRRTLQDEVRTAFADDADIDMTTTGHLEYLNACLEETLRMYPPTVTIVPRVSPGAEVGGRWLPRGTLIHIYTTAAFRDPANFVDPDSFHPERWLKPAHPLHDPRFDGDRREVFKPFSTGPRDCVGKNLAYAEMRVVASRLVRGFDFEMLPGQDDWMASQRNGVLWLKNGFNIKPSLPKTANSAVPALTAASG